MGSCILLHKNCPPTEISVSLFQISECVHGIVFTHSLLYVSDKRVLVVAATGEWTLLTLHSTSGNDTWSKQTLVPPEPVSCDCSYGNRVAVVPHSGHVVYVNQGETLSCVHVDTNRIVDIPLATKVWKVYYYASNSVLYVETDRLHLHLVDLENNTNEFIEYPHWIENAFFPIDNVTVLDAGHFIVLTCCSRQFVVILNVELPRVFFVLASAAINPSVPPCFVKELNMFLFSGNSEGELLLVLQDKLTPSTDQIQFLCREHHRVRLDFGKICRLVTHDSFVIVCDAQGTVIELPVFCRVCSKQEEKERLHTYYMVAAVTSLRLGRLAVVLWGSVSHVSRRRLLQIASRIHSHRSRRRASLSCYVSRKVLDVRLHSTHSQTPTSPLCEGSFRTLAADGGNTRGVFWSFMKFKFC